MYYVLLLVNWSKTGVNSRCEGKRLLALHFFCSVENEARFPPKSQLISQPLDFSASWLTRYLPKTNKTDLDEEGTRVDSRNQAMQIFAKIWSGIIFFSIDLLFFTLERTHQQCNIRTYWIFAQSSSLLIFIFLGNR